MGLYVHPHTSGGTSNGTGKSERKKALQGIMKEPSSRRCLSDHSSDNLTPTGVRNPILKPRREAKMVNIDLRARHCPDAITE